VGKGERLHKVNLPEAIKGQSLDKIAEKLRMSGSTYSRAKKVNQDSAFVALLEPRVVFF